MFVYCDHFFPQLPRLFDQYFFSSLKYEWYTKKEELSHWDFFICPHLREVNRELLSRRALVGYVGGCSISQLIWHDMIWYVFPSELRSIPPISILFINVSPLKNQFFSFLKTNHKAESHFWPRLCFALSCVIIMFHFFVLLPIKNVRFFEKTTFSWLILVTQGIPMFVSGAHQVPPPCLAFSGLSGNPHFKI